MIKEVPCMECDGKGFIAKFGEYSVWSERCPNCGGTGIVKVPMTNADRIRAMSDEELAVFLDGFTCNCIDCRDNDGKNESCPIYNRQRCRYCEPKDIMDWLQSPTKEDT